MDKKIFTIKSEDKAAFINRLEKLDIGVESYNITDNKLENSFSIAFEDPKAIDTINQILKKSPKIDQAKTPKSVYTDEKAKEKLGENKNAKDVIKLDVPLFIRLLEYAREDAKTDMDLHDVAENIISLSTSGKVLDMGQYNKIVSKKK
jgi:hypothetical protein